MAEDQLQILASKADYEALISDVEGQMSVLNGIADEYAALKAQVNQFMGEQDDNFEQMKANVEENVKAVHQAYGMAELTRRQLQATVDEMDDLGTNVGSVLESGVGTIKSAVETVIHVNDIL